MKTSTLSLAQWRDLESKASAAGKALDDLKFALLQEAMHCERHADSDLRDKLLAESKKLQDAMILPAYFYHCQPEWTGGDSSDPANHKLVEPHIASTRRTVA